MSKSKLTPKIYGLQYDGTNSAEFVSEWEGQASGSLTAEASVLSESAGEVTFRFDSAVDASPVVSEWEPTLATGDWILFFNADGFGGPRVIGDEEVNRQYDVEAS